jgi:ribosomal protein S18 acetylase RimI-like enzyme
MSIITADHLSSSELLEIWNRGFAGYYVDNTLDDERLAKHLRWSAVDLSRSAVLLVDEKPAAFSLAAIERRGGGLAAWIAGFGVAPEHRRQGLAGQLMQGHCRILDDAGILETLLEVIDINPARRVYSAAGFRETRTLPSYQGRPQAPAGAPAFEWLDLSALEELHATLHETAAPVWRRELPVLLRIIQDQPTAKLLALPAGQGYCAYALAIPGVERVTLLDAASLDLQSGRRLLEALGAAFDASPLRIIDEPAQSPMAEALAAAGLENFLTQVEMVRVR